MKVRVKGLGPTQIGYANNRRWKNGDVFELKDRVTYRVDPATGDKKKVTITAEQQFSRRWMEKVEAKSGKASTADKSAETQTLEEDNSPTGEAEVL